MSSGGDDDTAAAKAAAADKLVAEERAAAQRAAAERKAAADKAVADELAAHKAAAAKKAGDKTVADKAAADKKAGDKVASDKAAAAKADADGLAARDRLPTPPSWWKTLRADPPAVIRLGLGIAIIALLLLVWWFVTRGEPVDRIISPSKLPSPGEVFGSFSKLLDRHLGGAIADTLQRVFLGVLLAAIVGVLAGVIAGANRGIGSAVAPLLIFLRSVPMGALIPLTLMLFGVEEKQKIMFIFLAIVPFVFSDTVKAISIVPERYVETAQTLGASNLQIIAKVLVPLALPDIITSLRFQFGLALGYIVLAEAINTPTGLGTLISLSERQGISEHVYLLLFVIALIAFSIDLLLRTLQRGVFPWRRDL